MPLRDRRRAVRVALAGAVVVLAAASVLVVRLSPTVQGSRPAPTKANLAMLTARIPPGFRRDPYQALENLCGYRPCF